MAIMEGRSQQLSLTYNIPGDGMGLDVYALRDPGQALPEEDQHAFDEAGIELCGGHLDPSHADE